MSRRKKDRKTARAKKRRGVTFACAACGDKSVVRRGGDLSCRSCLRLVSERFRSAVYEWTRLNAHGG